SDQEIHNYLGALGAGVSPASIALVLTGGPEKEQQEIIDVYRTLLGRTPSPGEIAGYMNALASGSFTIAALRSHVVGSPEYYGRLVKGQNNDVHWIESAYRDLLGRAASAHEINRIWGPNLEHQMF